MTPHLIDSADCHRTIQDIQVLLSAISDAISGLKIFAHEAKSEYEHEVSSVRIFRQILHMVVYRADLLLARVEHRRHQGPYLQFHQLLSDTSAQVAQKLKLIDSSGMRNASAIELSFRESAALVEQKLPEFQKLELHVQQLLAEKQRLVEDFAAEAEKIEYKLSQITSFPN